MKQIQTFALIAAMTMAAGAAPTVTLTSTAVNGASYDVLTPPTVTAAAQGADWVRAEIWQGDTPNGDHGAVHCYFTQSGSSWTGTFPVNHAGDVFFRLVAGDDSTGETVSSATYSFTYTENFESSNALGPVRRPVFGGQGDIYTALKGSGYKTLDAGGWHFIKANMEYPPYITLRGVSAQYLDLLGNHSQMYTLENIGAGTIWFKARAALTNDVILVVSRNVRNGRVITRTTLQEVTVPADGLFHQYQIVVQDSTPGMIAIRNSTSTGTNVEADEAYFGVHLADIVVTPPQPDVSITRLDNEYQPGFPSIQDPVVFRCAVSNLYDAATASCITPKLVWRQNAGWNVSPMTNELGRAVQEDGVYAVSLSVADGLSPGPFEYFFRADFAGYTPVFPAVNEFLGFNQQVTALVFDNTADAIAFNVEKCAETDKTLAWADASAGVSNALPVTAYAVLSRSPAYSFDLEAWRSTSLDSNVARYALRDEDEPAIYKWELSHRFDVENLDGLWLRSLKTAADEVVFRDEYSYLSLLASDGVRRFRSLYNDMALSVSDHPDAEAASHLAAAYPMQQVDDYIWQAIIRLTNEIDVAVCVTSDWQYSANDGVLEQGPYAWGQIDQDETAINPPMSGELALLGPGETVSGWNPVRTQMNYQGFMMFRFCTTNGEYQVRRAAWQDFNDWQADDEIFSQSYGLYGATRWVNNVEDVALTDAGGDIFSGFEYEKLTPSKINGAYYDGLMVYNAWIVRERVRATGESVTNVNAKANYALRLSTAKDTPGSAQTTFARDNNGKGRGILTFRARATTEDDRAVYYTGNRNAMDWTGKRFVGHFGKTSSGVAAANMSEGHPSLSVYGYWQDPDNYWEARLTQTMRYQRTSPNNQPGLALEIFKREKGVLERVAGITNYNNSALLSNRSGGFVIDLDLAVSGSTVTPKAYVRAGNTFTSQANNQPAVLNIGGNLQLNGTYSRNTTVTSGTIGFNTRDCATTVAPYVYEAGQTVRANGYSDQYPDNAKVSTSAITDWTSAPYDSVGLYRTESPWTVTAGSVIATSPTTLLRDAHEASFRVSVVRSGVEDSDAFFADLSDGGWKEKWDVVNGHTSDGIFTVSSFGWTNVKIPMMLWDDTFISIEALSTNAAGAASTANLLIDDIDCTEWRGDTVYEPDTGVQDIDEYDSWKATYAVVLEESLGGGISNREYSLDRSRTNPGAGRDQMVVTPVMENGVGDIIFSYRVDRAAVKFTVDYITSDGGVNTYREITVEPSEEWSRIYVPILSSEGGRIRIHTESLQDSSTGAELYGNLLIDNLAATDYPNDESTSWEGYNILVSTFRTNAALRVSLTTNETVFLKFDSFETPVDEFRSGVLNDYPDRNTGDLKLFEHRPYVQTPSISTGIGEVSFWYRRSPDCTSAPVSLKLLVAPVASPLDEDWTELTIDNLNTNNAARFAVQKQALEGLSSIENDDWVRFTAEFYSKDFKVLRLVGETNGNNRVMIDNILITEPVRASISVGDIVFDPDIPLSTDSVGAKIRLVNPKMNPRNIRVRLEYFAMPGRSLTPELWGYNAWKGIEQEQLNGANRGVIAFTNTVSEVDGQIRTNAYEFVSAERIPRFAVDNVVQYCAVVEYDGDFAAPIWSETQDVENSNDFFFENPAWYEPTDLNETFGSTNHPVAHYWVFSCTTNVVWVNELKYFTSREARLNNDYKAQAKTYQFVELMGPEGASLAGWTVEHFGSYDGIVSEDNATWTNTVSAGAVFQPPTNPSEETNPKGWGFWTLGCSGVPGANQELFADGQSETVYMTDPGAIRIRRSMGADVDKIVWGSADATMELVSSGGFTYAGSASQVNRGLALQGEVDSGSDDEGSLVWQQVFGQGTTIPSFSTSFTVGGYNLDQELYVDSVDSVDEEEPVEEEFALFDRPSFTGNIVFLETGRVRLSFTVTVTNGVPLTASSGWTWYVDEFDDLENRIVNSTEITGIAVPKESTPNDFTATFDVEIPQISGDTNFYRIRASRRDD